LKYLELRWLATVSVWLHHGIYRAYNKQVIFIKCIALTEFLEGICSLSLATKSGSLGCVQ